MGTFAEQQSISTYWFNKASDLRRTAEVVFNAGQNNGVFRMLCGMSLELLLKALIVEAGAEPRRTHNLNELARDAGIVYRVDNQKLLQILSEAIIWDGRYPVPNDERHWDALNGLEMECLFDKKPLGTSSKLLVHTPNDKLNWDSFHELWSTPFNKLCKIASWIHT